MNCATFLLLTASLAWPQDTEDAKRAIAIVKKANGKLEFDEKARGKPVISLNL
jgi:hypothetical protein